MKKKQKNDEGLIQKENQLKERIMEFRSLFDNAIDAIYIQDKNGIFLDVNNAAVKMYGYSKEELIGKDPSFVSAPGKNDMKNIGKKLKKAFQGEPQIFEFWGKDKNGRIFPKIVRLAKGRYNGQDIVFAYALDITEIKEKEQLLKESEEKYKKLAESNPAGIAVHVKGKIVYVNRAGLKILGAKDEDEIIGKNIIDFVHSDSLDLVLSRMNETYTIKDPIETIHERLLKIDGTKFDAAVNGFNIDWDNKKAILVTFLDITREKRLEEEKLKLEREMAYLKQLENLGLLAGGIAHDFNNYLMIIMGNISLAKLFIKNNNKALSKLEHAEKAVKNAQNLTQKLLTFSKGGKPIKEVFDITELIKDSVQFILSGSNIEYELITDNNLWEVKADKGQINQVIQNIIINSKEAMPSGGKINIKLENYKNRDGDIVLKKGNYVKITIKDTGIGIPQEYIKKIFTPYFTTKKAGSGLGLSIVYSIVKNHKGFIRFNPDIRNGAECEIYLPAIKTKNGVIKKRKNHKTSEGKRKILVMDDEEDIRNLLYDMLEMLGYKVFLSSKGEEAIDIYNKEMKTGSKIDIVILDLTIVGGKGGKETIKDLKKRDPDVKAIVTSGYSNDPVISNYKKYGFLNYLKKPYNLEELKNVLESLKE